MLLNMIWSRSILDFRTNLINVKAISSYHWNSFTSSICPRGISKFQLRLSLNKPIKFPRTFPITTPLNQSIRHLLLNQIRPFYIPTESYLSNTTPSRVHLFPQKKINIFLIPFSYQIAGCLIVQIVAILKMYLIRALINIDLLIIPKESSWQLIMKTSHYTTPHWLFLKMLAKWTYKMKLSCHNQVL